MVMKKGGKERQLLTTLECETHKQALISEERSQREVVKARIAELQDKLMAKNSYMDINKEADKVDENEREKKERPHLNFDIAKQEEKNVYCQKCKRDSKWCPHMQRRKSPKNSYSAPHTWGHETGWGQNFDTLPMSFARENVCKQFLNTGHL